jgi:hypothetical protein
MATTYSPEVLQTYADRLYQRAKWLIGWYCLLGFLAGLILEMILFSVGKGPRVDVSNPGFLVLPLLGLIPGYLYGLGKAWQLKLEAQRTLCQLQIERNTRPPSSTAAVAHLTAST